MKLTAFGSLVNDNGFHMRRRGMEEFWGLNKEIRAVHSGTETERRTHFCFVCILRLRIVYPLRAFAAARPA